MATIVFISAIAKFCPMQFLQSHIMKQRDYYTTVRSSKPGVYLFYYPTINFYNGFYRSKKEKTYSDNHDVFAGKINAGWLVLSYLNKKGDFVCSIFHYSIKQGDGYKIRRGTLSDTPRFSTWSVWFVGRLYRMNIIFYYTSFLLKMAWMRAEVVLWSFPHWIARDRKPERCTVC